MSAKGSERTSKTAHVMNLLNKGRPAESAVPPAAERPVQAVPLTAIADVPENDHAVSSQIQSALEEALQEQEHASPAPVGKPAEPAERESVQSHGVPAEPTARESVPPPVEPEPPAPSPEVAVPPPAAAAGDHTEDTVTYVNVMQVLVEEKAEKYIKMFGLCQCPRCVVDVKALALSSLPPKYVVMHEGEMVPRITIYETHYSAAVTAQIMRACKIVMESPRHDL